MIDWLNMRYFWICTALMGVLSISRYMQGETDLVRLAISTVGGGLFWGVVVTFVARRFRK